jgi:hypothetical protein
MERGRKKEEHQRKRKEDKPASCVHSLAPDSEGWMCRDEEAARELKERREIISQRWSLEATVPQNNWFAAKPPRPGEPGWPGALGGATLGSSYKQPIRGANPE